MPGNILTPVAIWGGFKTDIVPTCTVVDQKKSGDISITRCFIDGRKINDQSVRIFVTITKSMKNSSVPAVVLTEDFDVGYDQWLSKDLAKKGYMAVSVDLAGQCEGKEYFTEYPESIEYANYQKTKDNLYTIKKDVGQTCWYEWGCVLRYVISYLKEQREITKIGAFGIAESSTALWHVAGFDDNLSCVAFAMNAGWIGYRGIYKHDGKVEPQFSDNMYKFIAGVEPQAYASHIKCPTLVLASVNSNTFDADRAVDTLSRIDKEIYTAIHYSVTNIEKLSGEAYNNLLIFFDKYLKNGIEKSLPSEPEIKIEMIDGKAFISVFPETDDIKNVYVYISEETVNPAIRSWKKLSKFKCENGAKYVFEYQPYRNSAIVTAFSKVCYNNGTVIGSAIVAKKFKDEKVYSSYKSNIIYSSRIEGNESVFLASNSEQKNEHKINLINEKQVKVLKGPMDIAGAYSKWGLLTFKINALKDKPNEDAILMFDFYTKENNEILVKLITDYYGNKTEYMARVSLLGGEVWHNVKLEKSKFKTAEGMTLKSYEKINAIEFNANEKWLLNNALWV